eukprot:s3412_g6.t1
MPQLWPGSVLPPPTCPWPCPSLPKWRNIRSSLMTAATLQDAGESWLAERSRCSRSSPYLLRGTWAPRWAKGFF